MPTPTLQKAAGGNAQRSEGRWLGGAGRSGGRASLTCFEHRQTVPRAQRLRLLEADFPWDVDVEEVNLDEDEGREVGVTSPEAAASEYGTFLCFRIRSPSGPNTVQVLYNFPPSSSGIDPGRARGRQSHVCLLTID